MPPNAVLDRGSPASFEMIAEAENKEKNVQLLANTALRWMQGILSGEAESSPDCLGSPEHVKTYFHPEMDMKDLTVEVITGGNNNVSLHVYDCKRASPRFSTTTSRLVEESDFPSEVFVKATRANASDRMGHQFFGMSTFHDFCPSETVHPLLCDGDTLANNGFKYLVSEFLTRDYDQYMYQFHEGRVDQRPAQAIGETIAKFHVQSRLIGREEAFNEETFDSFYANGYLGIIEKLKDYIMSEEMDHASRSTKELYRQHPEYLSSFDKILESLINPSEATGACIHHDLHVLNILVKENINPTEVNDLIKVVDFEFYNWGPIGADVGIYSASVITFALMHACREDEYDSNWRSLLQAVSSMWSSYIKSYVATSPETRADALKELYEIARQSVAWIGFVLVKYFSPNVFHLLIDGLLKAPDGLVESLESTYFVREGVYGLEFLRFKTFAMGHTLMAMGFEDEEDVAAESQVPEHIDPEVLEDIMQDAIAEVEKVAKTMRRQLRSQRQSVGAPPKKFDRRVSDLRSSPRRCSDSFMFEALTKANTPNF
eukprot:CAMPEP_0118707600 /NCGR_PEP_ID=MMETSP0800-20121206/21310_1 /TAXON_ID=210618 ORGANISM="Striatella unipunctata, Strain CCMP2910" /NCGR_SAMPLE_ID=MMETSP0800 /ASSEMBLY_ACC=CAM_ASM_000638 /LENGTH=544 /DNA_ID=CAMNT_0006610477 /DNA_START=11 /DNA_END=1645 /DNA_ORIENTATION=-